MTNAAAKPLFSYRPFWAKRFGTPQVLPMSRAEMEILGWDACDVIIVTGDAYVDHPAFGMAIIGRLLSAHGFRVGIIAQPKWNSVTDFQRLGKPTLCWCVTAGNMDSMVNHYTADKKIRRDDAYSPNGTPHLRPNRAATVYAQRCREAYKDVPIILGGIEASLRRVAHYDYWSDQIRRSILLDSKADLLIYGNGERAIVECLHRLARKQAIETITDIRGTAFVRSEFETEEETVVLPSFEAVSTDKMTFAEAERLRLKELNPYCARTLLQAHGKRTLIVRPPPMPLSTKELDAVYALPFSRLPHPSYDGAKIPAYEMIEHSITILRGCFGGCRFCAIAAQEGRIIQSRSVESITAEIAAVRDTSPHFTGHISDLGGPSANMYRFACSKPEVQEHCRKSSCLYPKVCPNLSRDHQPLLDLYQAARAVPGIKKIFIASGIRYDLALESPAYVETLATHHVGGYLKIAPEHIAPKTLACMHKPPIACFEQFQRDFDAASKRAGKEQYLIPYFIAAHPGTTREDMLELSLWLKQHKLRVDQVQTFLPTPMTPASAMYYCERAIFDDNAPIFVAKSAEERRIQKAFLRYHDPKFWPVIREALREMGNGAVRAQELIPKTRHIIYDRYK